MEKVITEEEKLKVLTTLKSTQLYRLTQIELAKKKGQLQKLADTAPNAKKRDKLLRQVKDIESRINLLERNAIKGYIKQVLTEKYEMQDIINIMSKEDGEYFNHHIDVVCFVVDFMESEVIKLNDVLSKYKKYQNVQAFNGVLKLGKNCRDILRGIHKKETDEMADVFATYADQIEKYMLRKIKSFVVEYNEAKDKRDNELKNN